MTAPRSEARAAALHRLPTLLLWLIGLLTIGALLFTYDAARVVAPLLQHPSVLPAVVAAHLLPLLLDVAAWRALLPEPPSRLRLLWVRWASEGVNGLVPIPYLGELLRVYAVGPWISRRAAAAAVVVDITLGLVSEGVFALAGIALYLATAGAGDVIKWPLLATALLAILGSAIVAAQRRGAFALGALIARKALGPLGIAIASEGAIGFDDAIRALYRDRAAIVAAFCWRLLAWIAGAGEIWIASLIFGLPLGPLESLALEALAQTVRTVGFVMPAGLGLQEGVFLLIGAQYGLAAEQALTLALVRRARELALGLPALVAGWALQWQTIARNGSAAVVPQLPRQSG